MLTNVLSLFILCVVTLNLPHHPYTPLPPPKKNNRVIRELLLKPTERINKNSMMQLLQGSVVPQVNKKLNKTEQASTAPIISSPMSHPLHHTQSYTHKTI